MLALADRHDLGDWSVRSGHYVWHDPQAIANEESELIEPRLVGGHDHPFQIVEVRGQIALQAPSHDLDRDLRLEGAVIEQTTRPLRAGSRHRSNERPLLRHDRVG